MLKREATQIVGGLSNPSKMPCSGYSLPAKACITGQRLASIPGTTCHGCYASKGMYQFPVVQAALRRRLESITHPMWVEAMVTLISGMPYFRWHDSGDLQSIAHLAKIAEVCRRTPDTRHWLPTRERGIVRDFSAAHKIPQNLVVRLSDTHVDRPLQFRGIPVSGVHTTAPKTGRVCPAPQQDGECRECRMCWNKRIRRISYHLH